MDVDTFWRLVQTLSKVVRALDHFSFNSQSQRFQFSRYAVIEFCTNVPKQPYLIFIIQMT